MLTIRTSKLLIGTLTVLFSTLACNAATSAIQPETVSSSSYSTIATEQAYCPAVTSSILNTADSIDSFAIPDAETFLVAYPVSGNMIGHPYYNETIPAELQDEQANSSSQQAIWNYFTSIIPEKSRGFLTEYSILTDGEGNLLAAVSQSYSDPNRWVLEVDIADAQDYNHLTFTLIHEFGHLLTLNSGQVTPSMAVFEHPEDQEIYNQEVAQCSNYFPGEGCSESDSYINQFYQRFWMDKYAEWNQVDAINDDYLYYEKLNEFYEKYQDQFVTDYAATNPGEDIAESWTHFVLTPKPQGTTIAEQKILFFYEFPELVQLRQEILNNLCNAFP
jgi:hypothetical protein